MLGLVHSRLPLIAALLITLLTAFGAHATECDSLGHHVAATGRLGDRASQAALSDPCDLLPTIIAASHCARDKSAPSADTTAVTLPLTTYLSGSALCEFDDAHQTRVETSNTALAHKSVTVLLV